MSKLSKQCEEVYIQQGTKGVHRFIKEFYPDCPWEYCDECEQGSPTEKHICLVCSNRTNPYTEW